MPAGRGVSNLNRSAWDLAGFSPSGCSVTLYIPFRVPHFHLTPGVDRAPTKALGLLLAPVPGGPLGDGMALTGSAVSLSENWVTLGCALNLYDSHQTQDKFKALGH